MKLKEYKNKRDFSQTDEPCGMTKKTKQKRFVVQFHRARTDHYDFRLEHDGVLLSWAIPKGLSDKSSDKRLAVHVEDHPVDYIDFSGIIPKGNYGAGTVEIFDKGTFSTNINLTKGLKDGNFKVTLLGKKLCGTWNFSRMDEKNWLAIKCKNKAAKSNPFSKVEVELATLSKTVPNGKNWVYEIKFDGYRIVAFCEDGKVELFSRGGKDYSDKFSPICSALSSLCEGRSFVLDGEVVTFDEKGRSNFSLLQKQIKLRGADFSFVVFDILALDGEDLREKTLGERKEILKNLLKNAKKNLIFSDFVKNNGKKVFEGAKKLGLEGIVAKDINSPYFGGRNKDWQKIKCRKSQEFVIGGFLKSEKNEDLSAILVGCFEGEKLKFFGKVGTGFDNDTRKELSQKLSKISVKKCPFFECEKLENAIWTSPKLVAQIEFAELTPSGVLRQASFLGLRDDKKAKDVVLEEENE